MPHRQGLGLLLSAHDVVNSLKDAISARRRTEDHALVNLAQVQISRVQAEVINASLQTLLLHAACRAFCCCIMHETCSVSRAHFV